MTWPSTSRQSRGYGAAWERTRADVLRRDNGLCQCDQCKGGELRVTVATEVHHVVSKAAAARRGWTRAQMDHPSNLAAMAHDCHLRADAEAQGKRLNPKTGFDVRGEPTDRMHPWFRERR